MKRWMGVICLIGVVLVASAYADLPSKDGLVFHLDASQLTGLTNDALVATWPDLSENAVDLMQPTTNQRPSYVTNAIGGVPAVRFTGSQAMTNLALSADWPKTAVSWFLVAKLDTINQSNNLLFALPDTNNNRFLTHFPHGNGNVYWDFGNINGNVGRLFTSRNNMGTDPAVWHMRAGNNGMAAVKNGGVYMQKTGNGSFNPAGKHLSLGLNFRGLVAEIIVYNRVLASSEDLAVGSYLADKYGIATGYVTPAVNPGDFAHKRRVEVTGYAGTQVLTNFPVWVKFAEDGAFSYADCASPNGHDLRFGLDASGEQLDFEIDQWDTNGTSCVWVRIPELANSTTFWAYWGNPGDTALPVSSTDGSTWMADYAAVWHMNEADAADSGVNNNAGTAAGTVGVTLVNDGRIGKGVDLPGSGGTGGTGYISVPSSSSVEMGSTFSASAWVTYERSSVNQWERLLNKKDVYNATHGWEIGHQQNSDQQMFMAGSAGSDATRPVVVDGWRNAQWEFITVVYDGATVHAYGNGVFKGDVPCTPVVDNSAWPFVIGNDANFNEYNWNGKIDEVRLADTLRSADWVRAEYDVVANNEQFLTVSDEINAYAATDITTGGATFNGELPWVAGTSDVLVCWGTSDGGMSTSAWDTVVHLGTFTFPEALAHGVSGLAPTTTYTYRFTTGGAWSDAVSFRTRFVDVDGLALWWDAGAIPGVADGETVGEWADWSGNANSGLQIQPERQPTLVANGIGGKPTVRFDGNSDGLYYDGNTVVNTDYTIFLVEHRRSTKDNNYILIGSVAGANQNLHVGYRTYSTFTHAHYANDYDMQADISQTPQPSIYAVSFNGLEGVGRRVDLNGELLGRDNSLTALTGYGGASLGAWENTGRHYDGDISELIVFDRGLSQAEQNEVGQYLADKYGIDGGYDAGDADAGTYAYSADITFGGYAGGEILTNFPVLVKLGEAEIDSFAYGQFASSNGVDLRFTLQGNAAALNHEVELWDTGGVSHVWVQVPAFTNATTITAYWGNPSLVGMLPYWQQDGAVWDDTFRGVWHLAQTEFPYGDSTLNDRDGTAGVAPIATVGAIGPAQVFDGATQKIDVPYASALNPTVYSVSCWARVDGGSSHRSPLTSRVGNPGHGYLTYAMPDNTWSFWQGTGAGWSTVAGPAVVNSEWAHLVMTFDGSQMYYYVNGVRSGPTPSSLGVNNAYPLRIGAGGSEGGGQYWFNGAVDEVRVCDMVRSSNWVSAAYANAADYTHFVSVGAAVGPGPVVEALAPTLVADVEATANGLLSTAAIPTTVWMYWGTSDGGTNHGQWGNTNAPATLTEGGITVLLPVLTAGTPYYYSFFASNALGTAWAEPSMLFTTKFPGYLSVDPTAGPNGSISPSLTENLDPGEDSSVYTFMAVEGYTLTNVIIDGTMSLGPVASHQFTNVAANHTIQALFGVNMYTVTVSQAAGGTISPDPVQPVMHGADSELLTITPLPGHYVVDVVADGISQGAVMSYQFKDVTGNRSLTAQFSAYPEGMDPSNLAFWIQADKVGVADGERPSRWPEMSGHVNDLLQPIWGYRPTLVTNGFNGRPALDFDGAQSMTNVAMNADWPTDDATIFVVAKADALAQDTHLFRSQPWAATRFSVHLPWSNGNNYFDYGRSAEPGRMFWGNAGTDQDSIWCFVNETGVYQAAWRNGDLKKSETTTEAWNPAGYRFEVGATYRGQIAELIIFNKAMDDLDRNRVGYYLQEKYALDTDYVDPTSLDLVLDITLSTLGQTVPTAAGPAALQGGAVEYVIGVTNAGPTNASGVVVTDLIPSELSYQSHSGGTYNDANGEWTIGGLARNTSTTLTITATINTGIGYGTVSNTASITAVAEVDRSAANDSATIALPVWQDAVASADYAHRVKITFPGYTRPETLMNFPALVTLGEHVAGFDYDGFDSALGADLRFTEADGETVVAHEIETWDARGDSLVWVRLPELQVGTYIWAYWGRGDGIESWSSPTNTADCVLWLKADAGVLTDGAGNVTNWLDQSGNGGSVSQTDPARQPMRVDSVPEFGGMPAVRFEDPADDGVGLGPVDLGVASTNDRTVIMVVKPAINATQGNEAIGADTGHMIDFGTWTQNHRLRVRNDTVNAFSGWNSTRYGRGHILAVVGAGGASVLSTWNGGEPMQLNVATAAFQWPMTALYVGLCSNLPNRSYEGDMAELIIYDRALTDDELIRVGMYLSAKYDIKTSYNTPEYTRDGTVWSQGYTGVWHLDATTIVDSGPNDAYGRPAEPDPAAGRVGYGHDFAGNEEIDYGNRASIGGNDPFTFSGWVKTSAKVNQVVFQQRNGGYNGQWQVHLNTAGQARFWCYRGDYGFTTNTTEVIADGTWHHITAVREGSEGRIYLDGQFAASHDPTNGTRWMDANISCGMGRDIRDNNSPFNGMIDETRLANVARSTNWIWAAFMNQASNSTFSGSETVEGAPVIENRAPTLVSGSGATLNGELLSTGTLATAVTLYWGAADGGDNAGAWANTNAMGDTTAGPLGMPVAALSPGAIVHYRYLASNAFSTVWASPTVSFQAPAAGEYAISPYAGRGGLVSPNAVEHVASGGDSANYTFAPDEGYSLISVVVDGTPIGTPANHQFTGVVSDHTIEALFEMNRYAIAVAPSTGGTVSPDPALDVAHGDDSETFSITPDPGYHVAGVLLDGQSLGARFSYTVENVTSNHTLTVLFAANPGLPVTSDLAFWVAGDAVGAADGGAVALWQDLSGNGRHAAQSVAAEQPVFTLGTSNLLNGMGAVRFDGLNDNLPFDGTFLAGTDYTVIMVEGRRAGVNHGYFLAGAIPLAHNNLHLGYRNNTTLTHAHWGNDYNMGVPGHVVQRWNTWAFVLDSGVANTRRTLWNGEVFAANATVTPLVSFEGATVGASKAVPGFYAGDIAEVIVYTRALGDGELEQVEDYLSAKYYPALPAPGRVADPIVWAAADHITDMTNGATVTTWPDRSGTGHHLTRWTGAPHWIANQLNGKPVVRFDGSNGSHFIFPKLNTIRTAFWVLKEDVDASAVPPRFLLGDTIGGGGSYDFHRADNKFIWHGGHAPLMFNGTTKLNGAVIDGRTTAAPTAVSILSVRTSGNARANAFSYDRNIGDRTWDGDVAELIIYDRVLSDDEENRVGAYLVNKYGISAQYSLPGTLLLVR